ncbi:ABC transporter permease [Solwaraspora sp. WMMD1047]|uniref:ABC transporter permease n=1 Tax=Solwaraspora sp. WMMD1047 TaxID=3016102 RepID=UPI002417A67D|nr:ABC transporter permease [Solwaraspora sp. WMMD1047]MDG4834320.1 ABC transporter permease [Solwaraspora sp. WMMD1047]
MSAPSQAPGLPAVTPDGVPPPRPGRSLSRLEPYLLGLPGLIFMIVFFLVPVARMMYLGLTVENDAGGVDWSWSHWASVFEDDYGRAVLFRTLRIGFWTTVGCLVLAYPLALWVRQISPAFRSMVILVVLSPLLTSSVVRMLGWVLLLYDDGIVNETLGAVGIGPLTLLYRESAIVIGAIHVFFGFMFLALLSAMSRIRESEIEAAMNLGAGRLRVIREIVFPVTIPGVIGGCVIVFSLACSEYAIANMLGGSSQPVMGSEIYKQALVYLQWDRAAGIATILFLIVTVAIVIFSGLLRRRALRGLSDE